MGSFSQTLNMIRTVTILAATTLTLVSGTPRQCYSCGYKKVNNATETQEIGDLPFCGDFTNPMDNLANCTAESDCCAVMKEMWQILDEATNETRFELIARHGCESDLDHFPNHENRPFCRDYDNKCYNYEESTLPDHNDTVAITKIETCFCNTDRCNVEEPIFTPDTTPNTDTTTTAAANVVLGSVLTLTLSLLIIG